MSSMGGSQPPRGAGGRRRYVPDWPRNVARTRQRMGRVTLFLGVMIFLSFVALLQLDRGGDGGGDADAPRLVRGNGGWRYAGPAENLVLVTVERVIDGDTLIVRAFDQTPLRVRLFGVNAPEAGERCGEEATERLAALAGEAVRLLSDQRLEDAGGRQLRYLFTPDGVSIDAALITGGLARAWEADGTLRDQLVTLEEDARRERRGCLWADG